MEGRPLVQDLTRLPWHWGYVVRHSRVQNMLVLGQALYRCSVVRSDRSKETRGHLFRTNLFVLAPVLMLTRHTAIGNTTASSAVLEGFRLLRLAAGVALVHADC